jgi:phosphomannomutase
VVIWHLDGSRLVVRPSGTEPKVKGYVEVVEPVGDGEGLAAARSRATETLGALTDALARATGLA